MKKTTFCIWENKDADQASEKSVKCGECEKRFHTSCISLDEKELLELESGNGSWYCTNCKADCGLCSGAVLYGHNAVQCDKCEMWIHNKCSLITESEFDSCAALFVSDLVRSYIVGFSRCGSFYSKDALS